MEEDSGPLARRKGAAMVKQNDADGPCSVCAQASAKPDPPTVPWPKKVGSSVTVVTERFARALRLSQEGKG